MRKVKSIRPLVIERLERLEQLKHPLILSNRTNYSKNG